MITRIIKFLTSNLVQMTDGAVADRILSAVKISVAIAPFAVIGEKITKWSIANHEYILIVMMAILLDWFFGVIKHLGAKTFSLGRNAKGLILKLTLTTGAGMLFEGLSFITQDTGIVIATLTVVTRLIVFLYPAVSAWQNIYIVSGEKFPPKAWMDRLNSFGQNLDLKTLTDEKDTTNSDNPQ